MVKRREREDWQEEEKVLCEKEREEEQVLGEKERETVEEKIWGEGERKEKS